MQTKIFHPQELFNEQHTPQKKNRQQRNMQINYKTNTRNKQYNNIKGKSEYKAITKKTTFKVAKNIEKRKIRNKYLLFSP